MILLSSCVYLVNYVGVIFWVHSPLEVLVPLPLSPLPPLLPSLLPPLLSRLSHSHLSSHLSSLYLLPSLLPSLLPG